MFDVIYIKDIITWVFCSQNMALKLDISVFYFIDEDRDKWIEIV